MPLFVLFIGKTVLYVLFLEIICHDLALVHVVLDVVDLLIGLVTLAHEHDHVVPLCVWIDRKERRFS